MLARYGNQGEALFPVAEAGYVELHCGCKLRGCRSCTDHASSQTYHQSTDAEAPISLPCTLAGFNMAPLPMRRLVFVLAFLPPSLSFNSSPRLPIARRRHNSTSHENMSVIMVARSRAEYVRSCAAAIIAVTTTQRPASSSATTPTTVVSAP